MSTSHADVGRKFGRAQPAKGSRMESTTISRRLSPHFTSVADGGSYRTTVAHIVVNHHTQKSELWLCPLYYSPTTNRHMDHFREGFIQAFMAEHGSLEEAYGQIFVTHAVNSWGDRCEQVRGQSALANVTNALAEVDRPRLRNATRMGNLMSCLNRTQSALRLMTQGVPHDYPHAETVASLRDMQAFITNTMALYRNDTPDSIDEVRASVRAWLELNNPKNQ